MTNFIKLAASALGGLAGFMWGQLDGLLLALIVFMAVDYLTGVAAGFVERKLSSQVGAHGLIKKVVILLLVAIGHIMDTQLLGGGSAVCRSAVIGFYMANEGLSILENTTRLGVPWPPALRRALAQLQGKEKEGEQDHENLS